MPTRSAPGLTAEPAWPALRGHLLLLAADGADPITELQAAAGVRELDSADDRAAVLDWRLDDTGLRERRTRTAALAPRHPPRLASDQSWGRTSRPGPTWSATLADQVRSRTRDADQRRPGPHRAATARAGRRCRGVAGRDAGQPRRPPTHRTRPTPKGRPRLAATPRRPPRRRRTPPPCRNGDRPSPRPDAQRASTPSCPSSPNGSPPSPAAASTPPTLLNTAINDRSAAGRARRRRAVVADQPPPPTRRHRRRRPRLSHHHRLDRPAGRAGRRRPGRPAPSQPVVARAGVGGRPCAAARLAPRTTPHRHHNPTGRRRVPALLWRISHPHRPGPDHDQARRPTRRSADRHRSANRPTAPRRADRERSTPRFGSAPPPTTPTLATIVPTWSTRIVGLSPTWPSRRWSATPVSDSSRPTWT